MKSTNKLTQDQLDYIISTPAYITKSKRKEFNQIKGTLLDEIKKTFGCSWYRMKEGTQKAFDFVCFLSTEKGYFYASASKTAAKHGISEKTIYRLLKTLLDEGVLVKKNFESVKHNGLGCAVYFFKSHPYFQRFNEFINFTTDENYNENLDEKPENSEKLCVARNLSDDIPSTYNLPNYLPKEIKDIHPKVERPNFIQFVPKVINKMFLNELGNKLKTIWVKVSQAFKYVKHPMLTKDSLYIIAKNTCFQIIKSKKHLKMKDDQLAGYTYKTALNMAYEHISQEFLVETELKSPEIDLEYDFNSNQTYVLLPPHKHTKMHDGHERESTKGMFSDLQLSIYCNEIVYKLENQFTKINSNIGYSELKEQVLSQVANKQDENVTKYIAEHYEELTFNKHRLECEQALMIEEYKELAIKLGNNSSSPNIQSELPF